MRVLVADDEPKVRSALSLLLQHEPGVEIVLEADGAENLEAQLARNSPDVMLLDWELPGIRPDRLLSTLLLLHPALKVVALSMQPEARQQAMASGADAFVSKGNAPDDLLAALRSLKIKLAG